MEHILKRSSEELENIHTLVASYRVTTIKAMVFSFIWKSFKKTLLEYAVKKEEILMNYSSLYSDISKDIHDSHAKPTDVEHVRESILYITETIEECGKLLEQLIAHSHKQEEIVEHEKKFFVHLLESFNKDLLDWVWAHEKEVFWEITKLSEQQWKTSLESWKALLELQKKRLESHINNISSIK